MSNKVEEEGKVLSWRKDFVLTVDFDKFQLPCVVNVASFLLDEEKKVAVCCDVCDEEMKGKRRTESTLLVRICINRFMTMIL